MLAKQAADPLTNGLDQRAIDYTDIPRKFREQALLLKSTESDELHLRRTRGKPTTKRAANEVLQAVLSVMEWTGQGGSVLFFLS